MWKTASAIVCIVLVLVTLGVVMLASTSSVQGETLYHDAQFFLKHQLVALVVGFLAAAAAARVDYHIWKSLAIPLGLISMALLVMAILPGVGIAIKGSSRWLRLGPVTFEPSEFAKFTIVLVLSWWMTRVQRRADELGRGLLVPLALLGLMVGLIFIEPDFGTTMLMATVGMAIMFVGGARIGYLVISGVSGMLFFTLMIMHNPVRMRRIIAFLDPNKYAQDQAYQLLNAIYAFVVGGASGVGLGQSLQKQFYLPEAHTDFIFAIIGEELGLVASLAVVLLFLAFFLCGIRICMRASDAFGRLMAFGISATIALQAVINIGVVTGCLPTKGLPLPFISYGGTSMVVTLMMVGVLVNIALQAGGEREGSDMPAIKDRSHRW